MSDIEPHTVFSVLEDLARAKIHHSLLITRENAVTVVVTVPGQRWEIDVYQNGEIDVEVFKSTGEIVAYQDFCKILPLFSDS